VKRPSPILLLLLALTSCFSLATVLELRAGAWNRRANAGGVLKVMLGDGRQLFANSFFVKADVAFHGGYYPSVFDQAKAPSGSGHMTAAEGSDEEEEHERRMNFLDRPRDWIERFGRHFIVTEHRHLGEGRQREVLPWLKLAAELDPQRVDTYAVAAFWLGTLGKTNEAREFLREGIRNNPTSYVLYYELGRHYRDIDHDLQRARNVWELALRYWRAQEAGKEAPDNITLRDLTLSLGRLEEKEGRYQQAIGYLEITKGLSPNPGALDQQIAGLRAKLGSNPTNSSPSR
jgi:tetratricopeptide (TPR) repeat protein